MLSKRAWYFIHAALIVGCIILAITCLLDYSVPTIAAAIPCAIAYYTNEHFKNYYLGFYYERRENIEVDIIDTEWEYTE